MVEFWHNLFLKPSILWLKRNTSDYSKWGIHSPAPPPQAPTPALPAPQHYPEWLHISTGICFWFLGWQLCQTQVSSVFVLTTTGKKVVKRQFSPITALANINHFRHEPHPFYSPVWGSIIFFKGQPEISSWIFNVSQEPQGKTAEMLGIPLNAIRQLGCSDYVMMSVFNICAGF